MKLRLPLFLLGILISGTMFGQDKLHIDAAMTPYDSAVKVFALTEANRAQYQLDLLRTQDVTSHLRPNLDVFEKYFPLLPREEQFKLILLILANYDFDGEYGERFQMMIKNVRSYAANRLQGMSRSEIERFATAFGSTFEKFAQKCDVSLSVKLTPQKE